VRGKEVPQEVIDLARATGIIVLATRDIMYVASGKLYAHGLKG
jgi:hypothetical protein